MHPRLAQLILSEPVRRLTEAAAWRPRRVADFYCRVDDPYCVLMLQALPTLCEAAGLSVRTFIIPHPAEDVLPEPEKAAAWARSDVLEMVRHVALDFDAAWRAPTGARLRQATAAACKAPDLATLGAILHAAWSGAALDRWPVAEDADRQLAANARRLRRKGHYNSAMLHFQGSWYWGIDRLTYLEGRLDAPTTVKRRVPEWPEDGPKGPLEFFFSFRSPYSYVAVQRLRALLADRPVELRLRPVLPMVMRGLPVPTAKRLYIARDAAREARAQGVPYGRIADPVGPGVERCFAIYQLAAAEGAGLTWLETASRGIWAEGVVVAEDKGLRHLVEAAGLSWAAAQDALKSDGWRLEAESNRQRLFAAGLWGVPSFVWGDLRLWGQDRMAALEAWLARYAR